LLGWISACARDVASYRGRGWVAGESHPLAGAGLLVAETGRIIGKFRTRILHDLTH
jgi:hypothetical protein